MPRLRFGLRARLSLGFAVILILSMSAVAVFTGYVASREVEYVQQEQDRVRSNRVHIALSDYYASNGSWQGVDRFVSRIGFQTELAIVVRDGEGNIVGEIRQRFGRNHRDRHYQPIPLEFFTPIISSGMEVGSVATARERRGHFVPVSLNPGVPPAGEQEPSLTGFADAVQRTLTVVGLGAIAAGVLLVMLFSRRVLGSIGRLTAAARRLGGGDLSSRVSVRGNDEVAELGRAFNNMADALEGSERQRRSMVADVAHELRTPLANIQGHIEAMQDGLLPPDSENLDTIHQQTLNLNRLVDDLRLLAESESRDLRLTPEPVSLADLVNRVSDSFRPRTDAASIELTVSVDDSLPLVNVDRLRIEQVLTNLMDNAVDHTPLGGNIAMSAENLGEAVRVSVADTGPGIPEAALPRVFDRLYRADPSRQRETGGSGLGLAIARQLVEAHGGAIWAESVAGSGSRFGFDLPAPELDLPVSKH